MFFIYFFFFKQKTAYEMRISDWRSDVFSSDLIVASFDGKEILMNTSPSRCRELAIKMQEKGIKPEWEVFSPTHLLQDVVACIKEGLDKAPYLDRKSVV